MTHCKALIILYLTIRNRVPYPKVIYRNMLDITWIYVINIHITAINYKRGSWKRW